MGGPDVEHSGNRVAGLVLVVVGLLLLAARLFNVDFNWSRLWPVVAFLLPSLGFHLAWISTRNWGLLIPGGIMLTYGILFLCSATLGYGMLGQLWPLFIAGPGLGMLEAAVLGGQRQMFWSALPLLTVAGVALAFTMGGGTLWIGLGLVLLGGALLLRRG